MPREAQIDRTTKETQISAFIRPGGIDNPLLFDLPMQIDCLLSGRIVR